MYAHIMDLAGIHMNKTFKFRVCSTEYIKIMYNYMYIANSERMDKLVHSTFAQIKLITFLGE